MSRTRGHFKLAQYIGHRGLAAAAPENSLAGLRCAARAGFGACEIDVQAAADGVAVLHHDFELGSLHERELVHSLASDDLAQVKIGTCPETQAVQYIPTLHDALSVARELGLKMVVEIKTIASRADADLASAAAVLDDFADLQIIISSFEPVALELAAERLPNMPLAANMERLPQRVGSHIDNIHFAWREARKPRVRELAEAGLGLYAYTVNSAATAQRLFELGVDGVFTDKAEVKST